MKKIFISLIIIIFIFTITSTILFGNYDSATDMQPLTGSVAFTQIQDNFKALDGSSGTPPVKLAVFSGVEFEGGTTDSYETLLTVDNPTADSTVKVPNYTSTLMASTLDGNIPEGKDSVWGVSNGIGFEGTTADEYEILLKVFDPVRDTTLYLPNSSETNCMLVYSVDSTIGTRGLRIESGTGTVAGDTGVTSIATTVSYPTGFTTASASIPVVSGSVTVGGDNVIWTVSGAGSDQFIVTCRTQDGSNFDNTATGDFFWIVTGK